MRNASERRVGSFRGPRPPARPSAPEQAVGCQGVFWWRPCSRVRAAARQARTDRLRSGHRRAEGAACPRFRRRASTTSTSTPPIRSARSTGGRRSGQPASGPTVEGLPAFAADGVALVYSPGGESGAGRFRPGAPAVDPAESLLDDRAEHRRARAVRTADGARPRGGALPLPSRSIPAPTTPRACRTPGWRRSGISSSPLPRWRSAPRARAAIRRATVPVGRTSATSSTRTASWSSSTATPRPRTSSTATRTSGTNSRCAPPTGTPSISE